MSRLLMVVLKTLTLEKKNLSICLSLMKRLHVQLKYLYKFFKNIFSAAPICRMLVFSQFCSAVCSHYSLLPLPLQLPTSRSRFENVLAVFFDAVIEKNVDPVIAC